MTKRVQTLLRGIVSRFHRGERATPAAAPDPNQPPRCPTCAASVDVVDGEHGPEYSATFTPEMIALALDNERVARAVNAVLNPGLRLALVNVLLQGDPTKDGYFTTQDVEDEAEAGARSLDVARQLQLRDRNEEAAHFRGLSERHQRRAIRITALLSVEEQQLIKQRVHGGPIGNGQDPHIKIVRH